MIGWEWDKFLQFERNLPLVIIIIYINSYAHQLFIGQIVVTLSWINFFFKKILQKSIRKNILLMLWQNAQYIYFVYKN